MHWSILVRRIVTLSLLALIASSSGAVAQFPEMPPPQKEHEWLQQLVGEWESVGETQMTPDAPVIKSKGTESARSLGGFWIVADGEADIMGAPFRSVFTIGYDPEKKKYVATWVDSMTSRLWTYDGTVDASGKTLTFETRGPCPLKPGELMNFRETIEIKDKDHKVFTSSMQDEEGKWVKFLTVNYTRKK